jgi:hypothetical protein
MEVNLSQERMYRDVLRELDNACPFCHASKIPPTYEWSDICTPCIVDLYSISKQHYPHTPQHKSIEEEMQQRGLLDEE